MRIFLSRIALYISGVNQGVTFFLVFTVLYYTGTSLIIFLSRNPILSPTVCLGLRLYRNCPNFEITNNYVPVPMESISAIFLMEAMFKRHSSACLTVNIDNK